MRPSDFPATVRLSMPQAICDELAAIADKDPRGVKRDMIFEQIRRKEDSETEYIAKILDDDSLFRFAYIPFVVARAVWSCTETIHDLCVQMRIRETRRLNEAVKALRLEYERYRAPYIDGLQEYYETENSYTFEEHVERYMKQLSLNFRADIHTEYPHLHEDYEWLLVSVMQCEVVLLALIEYTNQWRDKTAAKLGRRLGNLLPPQLYELARLLPQFYGDKPASARFAKLKKQYIDTFTAQMGAVDIICLKNERR